MFKDEIILVVSNILSRMVCRISCKDPQQRHKTRILVIKVVDRKLKSSEGACDAVWQLLPVINPQ